MDKEREVKVKEKSELNRKMNRKISIDFPQRNEGMRGNKKEL